MWLPGAFHQLSLTNPTGQHTISHPAGTPNQFGGFLPTTTVATPTVPASTATTGPVQQEHQSQKQQSSPHWSPSAPSNSASPVANPPDNTEEEQLDPLVSALSFLTAPGKLPEPLPSMHVSALIKKRIWVGQYVDLAYLLETQPVPDDDKVYKFSCSNSNTNKLSLTTAKPKAKVDSYNSWNKAFRVLTEIVALKWPDQCLPMVQYATGISGNTRKFTFAATYNYDIKFRLKKQRNWPLSGMRLTTACEPHTFLAVAEMATILVPHHQLPSRRMTEQITRPAMISTSPEVPDPSADSHTNATNASSLVTTKGNVLNSSLWGHTHWLQLNESMFYPVTPVQMDRLEQMLVGHPNHKLVQRVVDGFHLGFSLKYNGPRLNRQPRNSPTAFIHSKAVAEYYQRS